MPHPGTQRTNQSQPRTRPASPRAPCSSPGPRSRSGRVSSAASGAGARRCTSASRAGIRPTGCTEPLGTSARSGSTSRMRVPTRGGEPFIRWASAGLLADAHSSSAFRASTRESIADHRSARTGTAPCDAWCVLFCSSSGNGCLRRFATLFPQWPGYHAQKHAPPFAPNAPSVNTSH
jgi:hypothetical protein